jgi:gas vesicle protein
MSFWKKVKSDLQKGIEEGMTAIKEGATVVKERAEELTEEGKRRYKILELKKAVRQWMTELGGMVYELSSEIENPRQNQKNRGTDN